MSIEIWSEPGAAVHLEVLRDCDSDGRPDRHGAKECQTPLEVKVDPPPDMATGYLSTVLDFAEQSWDLTENVGLWLRVSRVPDDGESTLAPFGFMTDACTLWDSLIDVFLGGVCDPGLLRALRRHKGPSDLGDVTFEVRRLAIEPAVSRTRAVPGTLGATGVAWIDSTTLLVTRAPEGPEPALESGNGAQADVPGLYRVDLASRTSEVLWQPAGDDRLPAAPFVLAHQRFAFVRQPFGFDMRRDDPPSALLSIWHRGELETTEIRLPYRIHQIVAASEDKSELLLLSLGTGANRPVFCRVDLVDGSVEVVGFHPALYHAALRSPNASVSAISYEDLSKTRGWLIELVDESGDSLRELVHRKARIDWMPAWRPDGAELAFLAEVDQPPAGGHR